MLKRMAEPRAADHREEQLQHELVGERTVHGKRPLKELNEPGGENGTVDRPGAEAPVEHYKAQHQKEHIDDGVEGRGGELGQQLSQQHRQAGHAAHGKMVGKFEKVDPHRHQQGAQVHQQEFAQQFLAVGHPFHFLSRW